MNNFLCKTQQQIESDVRLINGRIERKQCIHQFHTFQALSQGLLWMVAPSYQLHMPGWGPSGISNIPSLGVVQERGGRGIRDSTKGLSGGRQTSEDQHNLGGWAGGQWGGLHTWLCHFHTAQKFTQRVVWGGNPRWHIADVLSLWSVTKQKRTIFQSASPKEDTFLLICTKALHQFSSVQSCLTLCDPMDCSTPGLPVHHQLRKFTQT